MQLDRAIADVDHVVEGFIAAGRARAEPGNDLLSTMITAQDGDGARIDEPAAARRGHDVSSRATDDQGPGCCTWSWYLLSQHPEAEIRLADEWQRVLGGRSPRATDLSALPYTSAIIDKSMRVYPPIYVIGREATTDLELGGYRVKRGYTVLDESMGEPPGSTYFPGSGKVCPERWLRWTGGASHKFAYYPLGAGKGCASAVISRRRRRR